MTLLSQLRDTRNSEISSSRPYRQSQANRSLIHSALPQPDQDDSIEAHSPAYTFVVTADTQIGMTNRNIPPQAGDPHSYAEAAYIRKAIGEINKLDPKPRFCCVCGDLVDMTSKMFLGRDKPGSGDQQWTEDECNRVQDEQNELFQELWNDLDSDIPLVCICGNHDVGNRPSVASIQRFRNSFGDDYLSFWTKGSFNIVLNSSLISQPEDAPDLYAAQLEWLKEQLELGLSRRARNIFVFSHHPWFLYDENEDENELDGRIWTWAPEWGPRPSDYKGFPESYFPLPRKQRQVYLRLFEQYNVRACFAGHFHQNAVSTTSFGMQQIITGPLSSVVLPSSGNKQTKEPFEHGFRIVEVKGSDSDERGNFSHKFVSIEY